MQLNVSNICDAKADVCIGVWLKDFPLAHDPEGKTIGIIGMGGIGSVRHMFSQTCPGSRMY